MNELKSGVRKLVTNILRQRWPILNPINIDCDRIKK